MNIGLEKFSTFLVYVYRDASLSIHAMHAKTGKPAKSWDSGRIRTVEMRIWNAIDVIKNTGINRVRWLNGLESAG